MRARARRLNRSYFSPTPTSGAISFRMDFVPPARKFAFMMKNSRRALRTPCGYIAGAEGWVVLTKDSKIRYRSNEAEALFAAKVRAFVLVSRNLPGSEMANIFAAAFDIATCRAPLPSASASSDICAQAKREVNRGLLNRLFRITVQRIERWSCTSSGFAIYERVDRVPSISNGSADMTLAVKQTTPVRW